jgi:hypothetical protein
LPTRVTKAGFIPPMLLLKTDMLPEGGAWLHESKLYGYGPSRSRAAAQFSCDPETTRTSPAGIRPS